MDQAIELHDAAHVALDAGDARRALQKARLAVGLGERTGIAKFDLAHFHATCGKALEFNEKSLEARGCYAKALLLLCGQRGRDAAVLRVRCCGYAAGIDRALGDFAKARAGYRKALQAAERAWGPRDPEIGLLCNDWGVLEKFAGRYDDAGRLYRRALNLIRAPAELPNLFHNLGGLDHARGRFAAAERWARKSVEARRKLVDPSDPRLLADEAALAAILARRGDHAAAERIYRRAIRFFRRAGARYEVAVNANNLADSLADRRRNAEAARWYREALRLKRAVLGARHPDLALTLNNFAALRRDTGRRAEALKLFAQALTIFEDTAGPDHPHTGAVRKNLEALRSPQAHP
jgi:tetratricopeptide (TPR) repeat protein